MEGGDREGIRVAQAACFKLFTPCKQLETCKLHVPFDSFEEEIAGDTDESHQFTGPPALITGMQVTLHDFGEDLQVLQD